MDLGNWAVIDLETTGADPASDAIIDVGFYQFSHTTLVRKFSSLVHYPGELSQFIQKLTGITSSMVRQAPDWQQVEIQLAHLAGYQLVAHNAKFEASFLEKSLAQKFEYQDSIPYLALLSPGKGWLNLESFLQETNIRQTEVHRGLEDAADLLKVLIYKTYQAKMNSSLATILQDLVKSYQMEDQWFWRFFSLSIGELEYLASQIDFDLSLLQMGIPSVSLVNPVCNTGTARSVDLQFAKENIKNILRSESSIQELFPHYHFRQSQENLALKVGQCFKNKIHTFIQAPTGTGKTMGNLLPSILFALDQQEQVLIATGTKTLQEQAMTKDVPQIRSLLALSETQLPVVKLIGANNYFCEAIFQRQSQEMLGSIFLGTTALDERFAAMYFSLLFWANRQGPQKLGKGDLPYVLLKNNSYLAQLAHTLTVDLDACTHARCPLSGNCAYYQGQQAAKEAKIIIGNHALMFSWPRSFSRPGYVVVDEAHRIETEVTRAFCHEVNQQDLLNFQQQLSQGQGINSLFFLLDNGDEIKSLRQMSIEFATILHDHLRLLPEKVERWFKLAPRYSSEFFNERAFPQKATSLDAQTLSIIHHLESIQFILNHLSQQFSPFLARWDLASLEDPNAVMAYGSFSAFCHRIENYAQIFNSCLQGQENYAPVIKYSELEGMVLAAFPIDVGKILYEQLLQVSNSVVFTSASLANHDGSCGIKGVEWALGHLYLPPQKRFRQGLFLPGIFDYSQKARVFLCTDGPELHAAEFVPFVIKKVTNLIRQIQGRTLLLFSSRKRFDQARELLLAAFDGELPLFIQGMGTQVVDEYRKAARGILLGMESLGEGIDLPGDALQLLIIDKIPDLRMEHVIDVRRAFFDKTFGNEFTDYYLATRCRLLHQKLGRLLRTTTDVGGAIIFDRRILKWKEKTHQQFSHLMLPYSLHRATTEEAMKEVEHFLAKERGY